MKGGGLMKKFILLSMFVLATFAFADSDLKTTTIHGLSSLDVELQIITHYTAHSNLPECQEQSFPEPSTPKGYSETEDLSVPSGQNYTISFEAKADRCDYRITNVGIFIQDSNCSQIQPEADRCYDGIRLSALDWGNPPLVESEVASCKFLTDEGASYFTCATNAYPNPDIFHGGGFNVPHQYRLPSDVENHNFNLDIR
jgi:hypothetical protein